MHRFMEFINEKYNKTFTEYNSLYVWSIENIPDFWESMWDFAGIKASKEYDQVVEDLDKMPGARWFTGARLNFAENLIERFDVRTPSPLLAASTLSGGNQQKAIVARELSRDVVFLIANQPTRGLDVGSIEYIHRQIIEMRDRGVAVLLISAELDEIRSLSDRIAVMFRGEIVATVEAGAVTKEELGLMMTGSTNENEKVPIEA